MDINDTTNVEIKIDEEEIEVNLAADPLNIDADPLNIEADPLHIDADPLHIDADPLHIDADPLKIDADPLNIDADPLNIDADPLKIDADPLHIGADPSHIDADPLHIDADPLNIDADPLNIDADPLNIDAEPMKRDDCTWDPLATESQPGIAGLSQPGCPAYNAIKSRKVTNLKATDPLSLESEVLPKIEDPLKQEDCSHDPPTDILYKNENNQENDASRREVVRSYTSNLTVLGAGEVLGNVANCSKNTQGNTVLLKTSYVKCNICGKIYLNQIYLMLHKIKVHKFRAVPNQNLPCILRQPNPSSNSYLQNQNTVQDPSSKTTVHPSKDSSKNLSLDFKCDQCDRRFSTIRAVKFHINRMHQLRVTERPIPAITVYFKCDQCERTFGNNFALQKHKVKVHPSKEASESLASMLAQTVQKPDMEFKCHYCTRSFDGDRALHLHFVLTHLSKEERDKQTCLVRELKMKTKKAFVFKCDQCRKSFTSSTYLRCHKIKIHKSNAASENLASISDPNTYTNTDLVFKCDQCERAYCTRANLKIHIAKKHLSKEERYKIAAMKMNTDQPNTNLKCDQCEKSFSKRRNLQVHKVNKHLSKEEKKEFAAMKKKLNVFKCDHCENSYKNKSNLQLHMTKMHYLQVVGESANGEQANPNLSSVVKCDQCEETFSSLSYLKHHKDEVHQSNEEKELKLKYRMHKENNSVKRLASYKKRFKCNMCKISYNVKARLLCHKEKYHKFNGSAKNPIPTQISKCEKCDISFPYLIPYLCHELIDHQISSAKYDLSCWTSRLPAMPLKEISKKSETQPLNAPASATNGCENCLNLIPHRCHMIDDKADNTCQYCNQSFASLKSFKEHLFTHPHYLRSTCVFCDTRFISKVNLIDHLSANSCPRLQCKICFEYVFSESNIKEHIERHPKDRNIKCYLCPKVLKNRVKFKQHIKIHSIPRVPCPICSKLVLRSNLKMHIAAHSCKYCGLKFLVIDNPANRQHIRAHNVKSNSKRTMTCDICGKILSSKNNLRIHMSMHFKNLRVKCKLCKSTFSQPQALKYHMRTRHVSEQKFKCEMCGMSYAKEINLTIHKLRRHKIQPTKPIPEILLKEKRYKCSLCPKKFVWQKGLSNHILVEHNTDSEEVHVCDVCAMVFIKQNDLKLHWLKHVGSEILQDHFCKKCKKPFIQNVIADGSSSPTENQPSARCVCEVNSVEGGSCNSNSLQYATAMIAPVEADSDCILLSQLGVGSQQIEEDSQFPSEGPIGGGDILPDTAAAGDLMGLMAPGHAGADVLLDIVLPNELLDSQKEARSTDCKVCNITFATELELESHRQNHWDLKLTRKEARLYERRIKTHGEGSYTCSRCNKKFFVRNEFKEHLKDAILKLDGTLICDQKKVVRNHLRKPLPCEVCGKSFSIIGLYAHMRFLHPNSPYNTNPLKCSVCPATFRSKAGCYKHMRAHKNVKRTIPCGTCDETFTTKAGLRIHKRSHAKRPSKTCQIDKMVCSICNGTIKPTALQLAIKRSRSKMYRIATELNLTTNATPKPIKCAKCVEILCDICGQYIQNRDANLHRQTCTETSKFKPELKRSSKTSQIDKMVCSICKGSFAPTALQLVDKWRRSAMYRMPTELNVTTNATPKPIKCAKCSAAGSPANIRPLSRIVHEETKNVHTDVNEINAATPGSTYILLFHTYAQDLNKSILADPEPKSVPEPSPGPSPELLICNICNETFSTKRRLLSHLRSHEPLKKPRGASSSSFWDGYSWSGEFLCDICGRFILNRCSKLHMQKHSGFSCELCKESFTCLQRLRDHLRIHMRAMHFMCNICKKFSKTKSQLADHLTLDHNIPLADIDYSKHTYIAPSGPRFECNICGLDYCNQASLIGHQQTHRMNAPLIKCDVCNRTFARQSNLVSHMALHSSKHGDLECDFCKLRFLTRHQIELHMKHHIREKRFKCDQCSLQFFSLHRLKNHLFSHSQVRDFVCELCGRKYKRKCALSFHMKSHL